MKRSYLKPLTEIQATEVVNLYSATGALQYKEESIDPNLETLTDEDNQWDIWSTNTY